MTVTALVFAGLAAAIHGYIYVLEAFLWTTPRGRATFGTTEQEASDTRLLALNQGYYNLFLGIVTAIGVVLVAVDIDDAGRALVYAGCGSMAAAGVVLIGSDRSKVRPALVQLLPPLIAVIALSISIAA
jgi:putative membrane protein